MAKLFPHILLGGAFFIASALAPAALFDSIRPIIVGLNDPAPVAGETVNVTVTLNQASPDSEQLTISSMNRGAFSSLPTSVAVNTGDTQETFQATLADNASGFTTITASNAMGQASTMVAISQPVQDK